MNLNGYYFERGTCKVSNVYLVNWIYPTITSEPMIDDDCLLSFCKKKHPLNLFPGMCANGTMDGWKIEIRQKTDITYANIGFKQQTHGLNQQTQWLFIH